MDCILQAINAEVPGVRGELGEEGQGEDTSCLTGTGYPQVTKGNQRGCGNSTVLER